MTEFRVAIEKLAFGGSGIGRINGKVCFVPFSCPGDELLVAITAEKRSYLTAGIVEIITPSPDRVIPPCPLFGSCGGCAWQHIAYHAQLASKRQILAETLWRGARVQEEQISEVLPAPGQYGYRSRVQFKVFAAGDRLRIGFFRQGTHFVEDAPEGCPVALPVINQGIQRLRDVLSRLGEPRAIPQINIDCGDHGAVAIINYTGNDPDGTARFLKEHFTSLAPLNGLYMQTGRKSALRKVCGDDLLVYAMPAGAAESPPIQLAFRPGGFSQVTYPRIGTCWTRSGVWRVLTAARGCWTCIAAMAIFHCPLQGRWLLLPESKNSRGQLPLRSTIAAKMGLAMPIILLRMQPAESVVWPIMGGTTMSSYWTRPVAGQRRH